MDNHRESGKWGKKIPQRVFPGKKESLFGRKSSMTATGKYKCQLGYRVYSLAGQNNYLYYFVNRHNEGAISHDYPFHFVNRHNEGAKSHFFIFRVLKVPSTNNFL